jgi:hypothetical protein
MARTHSGEVSVMTNIDVQAEEGRAGDDGAISIKDFCRRNSIGTTTVYAEIAAGRLIARKCRTRTLIALEDEKAWRDNLPKIETSAAAAAQP